eukprot:1690656-Pleurochrysis_carterae.AAC.3
MAPCGTVLAVLLAMRRRAVCGPRSAFGGNLGSAAGATPGSNAQGAPRAHEELLVQILHKERVGSAVHCRRARCASLLTPSRDCTLPSGLDRIHVFAQARAVRRASVAG